MNRQGGHPPHAMDEEHKILILLALAAGAFRRTFLAGAVCMLVLAAGGALAADFSALQPQGYVSDFAGVVDSSTKAALERYCAAVEQSTGAEIALVTLETTSGEPIEEVALLLAETWGVGSGETDEGALLLLAIRDQTSRLEVGYGLEPAIPDGYAGGLLRQMRPALRAGEYGQAMAIAAQQLGQRIAQSKGVEITAAPARRQPASPDGQIPWGSLIGGIVFLMWMIGMGGRGYRRGGFGGLLTGMVLGSMMGRGMRGHRGSGGGFGGYDSFDSFGGFGGGDFGGGGASSNW